MAIKKTQIYSTLWNACNKLRGSMDASQYKDYVLILLFIKYLTDKSKQTRIRVPEGCSFNDFILFKGDSQIGEKINKALEKLKEENMVLLGNLTLPNFNDSNKFGKGDEMVKTLSSLIGVFQNDNLDFSKNRAAGDDILGDAYEYLMKNFAAESGKSKGQFYTPAEVSRTMAKLLHMEEFSSRRTTIYDPTCGSGSLLLRALYETKEQKASLRGPEKDSSTAALAILNMLLHGVDGADIKLGDTINNPQHKQNDRLNTFDICVANPPFSQKDWLKTVGEDDYYHRWTASLCPPAKCGDYAFLLHLIASMKEGTGRGACILPHGVLFRGAEATIRKYIVESGVIEGIVGLPANLFYGVTIPACILLLNKEGAAQRKGVYMIDAKNYFKKEGDKNKLREQDIRRIVDTWNARVDVPHYARFVPMSEIAQNDYNLNIPRYIQVIDNEIHQNVDAHLRGGLPAFDIDEQMSVYWSVLPTLKKDLFVASSTIANRYALRVPLEDVRQAVQANQDYKAQGQAFETSCNAWMKEVLPILEAFKKEDKVKPLGDDLGSRILAAFHNSGTLIDEYGVFDVLMEYWNETMQDDCYMISADGWKANIAVKPKKESKKKDDTGAEKKPKKAKVPTSIDEYESDLLPVAIVLSEYFAKEVGNIKDLEQLLAQLESQKAELAEQAEENDADEAVINKQLKDLGKKSKDTKAKLKAAQLDLMSKVLNRYATSSEEETRRLVIENKWIATLRNTLKSQMQQTEQDIVAAVTELYKRYENTLPELEDKESALNKRVKEHLKGLGYEW